MKTTLTSAAVLLLAGVVASAAPTAARQAAASSGSRKLDDARFIQGLRERGMKDLLLYFVEKYPPKDPVVKQEILIEQQKLNFEDTQLPVEKRAQAVLDVLDSYRALFKLAGPTHVKQPVWKTEFAAYVVHVVLPARYGNAAEFVEFGNPTAEQREAFDKLVAEIVNITEQASDEMFMLRGDLPKRDDFIINYENTGFWTRLNQDVGDLQLPLYRAYALHYGSMMLKPQGNPRDALAGLKTVLKQELSPGALAVVHGLQGRIMLNLAVPPTKPGAKPAPADPQAVAAAVAELKQAAESKEASALDVMLAQLAITKAEQATGKTTDALATVEKLKKTDLAKASPQLLIVLYDRQVALTGDQNLYNKLFDDPAAQPYKQFVQEFVARRFGAKPVDAAAADKEAPIVVLGQVEGVIRAGDEAKAAGDADKANKQYAQAAEILGKLLERKDIKPENAAKALFQLGIADYKRQSMLSAVKAWTDLAEKYPQQPESEGAAKNAVSLLQALYTANKDKPGVGEQVTELFDRALHALEKNFEFSEAAKLHTYTLAALQRARGRFADAAEWYAKVPNTHQFWVNAQYEGAISRHTQWLKADAKTRPAIAKQVVPSVDAGLAAVQQTLPSAKGEQLLKLQEMEGDLILMKAQVLAEGLGQPADAQALLKGFDEKYAKFPRLMQLKRPLGVGLLMAQGKNAEAVSEVEQFRQQFPDQAGPLIKGVLDQVLRQARDLRNAGNAARADELGDIAVKMADSLFEWAKTRPEFKEPAKLLSFEVLRGEANLAAGRPEKAADIFDELFKRPGGNAVREVLDGRMRAGLAAKRYQSSLDASNEILANVQDPKDPLFWPAWVHSMSSLDALANGKKDPSIFAAIAKLKARQPDLGGSPYNEELQRLQVKHQPQ